MKDPICPICGNDTWPNPRHKISICKECTKRTTDRGGRALEFFNEDMSGGVIAYYKGTKEKYKSRECYIDNLKWLTAEGHMGGIDFIPAPQEIKIHLSFGYILLLILGGLFSFGMLPLIFKFVVFSKYPRSIDEKGINMKNGKTFLWKDIKSAEKAGIFMFGKKIATGALELHFPDKYIVIPNPRYIRNAKAIYIFAGTMLAMHDKEIYEKKFLYIPFNKRNYLP